MPLHRLDDEALALKEIARLGAVVEAHPGKKLTAEQVVRGTGDTESANMMNERVAMLTEARVNALAKARAETPHSFSAMMGIPDPAEIGAAMKDLEAVKAAGAKAAAATADQYRNSKGIMEDLHAESAGVGELTEAREKLLAVLEKVPRNDESHRADREKIFAQIDVIEERLDKRRAEVAAKVGKLLVSQISDEIDREASGLREQIDAILQTKDITPQQRVELETEKSSVDYAAEYKKQARDERQQQESADKDAHRHASIQSMIAHDKIDMQAEALQMMKDSGQASKEALATADKALKIEESKLRTAEKIATLEAAKKDAHTDPELAAINAQEEARKRIGEQELASIENAKTLGAEIRAALAPAQTDTYLTGLAQAFISERAQMQQIAGDERRRAKGLAAIDGDQYARDHAGLAGSDGPRKSIGAEIRAAMVAPVGFGGGDSARMLGAMMPTAPTIPPTITLGAGGGKNDQTAGLMQKLATFATEVAAASKKSAEDIAGLRSDLEKMQLISVASDQ
jgi:hypothetical protein